LNKMIEGDEVEIVKPTGSISRTEERKTDKCAQVGGGGSKKWPVGKKNAGVNQAVRNKICPWEGGKRWPDYKITKNGLGGKTRSRTQVDSNKHRGGGGNKEETQWGAGESSEMTP